MSTQRDQLASHEETYKAAQRPEWVLKAARHQQGWDRLPFGHPGLDLTTKEFERALELAQKHTPGSEIELVRPLEKALKEQAAAAKKQEELDQAALKVRAEEEERRKAEAGAAKPEPKPKPEEPPDDRAGAEGEVR